MEFIERGIGTGDDKDDQSCQCPLQVLSQRPAKQGRENRVFGEVTAFTDDELDRTDSGIGDVRVEPAKEWTDESRRMLCGKQIGRANKDEGHPEKDWQPEFEEPAHRKQNHTRDACANLAPREL